MSPAPTTRIHHHVHRTAHKPMPPIPFHTYRTRFGDRVTFKFDPHIARNPDPIWPNDSAVSVCLFYESKLHFHSELLALEDAVKRWREDPASLQPPVGKVMYTETLAAEDGKGEVVVAKYVWKGWSHGEGYRRGWAKVYVDADADKGKAGGVKLM